VHQPCIEKTISLTLNLKSLSSNLGLMTELNGDRDVLVVVAVSVEPLHDGASVSTADSTQ
jgi:hypothetical protein